MLASDCVFCDIIVGSAPATVLWHSDSAMVIVPLNPVTEGHVIALPTRHVEDFSESIVASQATMIAVWEHVTALRIPSYNIITSRGHAASQTIRHLHVHVVPRREGDGLKLPWTQP